MESDFRVVFPKSMIEKMISLCPMISFINIKFVLYSKCVKVFQNVENDIQWEICIFEGILKNFLT